MNECEKYMEMISAMLDGELDHAGSEQLIAHMSSCAQCRELYELLSAVTGSEVWELPEAPEGLHEHIMSGVKSAAAEQKKRSRVIRLRPLAMTAACLVLIAGIVLGVPRFFRTGNSSAPAALNISAAASNNSAPADSCAPAEPASANNNAGSSDDNPEYTSQFGTTEDAASASSGGARNEESGGGMDSPEAAPVPKPQDEPEASELPALEIDIDRSVVTVESDGKSTTKKLSRGDTLIWLRAVIEDLAGGGFDAAKIEILRREGADYEVYLYRDGTKLMGSLTEDLADSIELKKLSDFAQFEELADSAK